MLPRLQRLFMTKETAVHMRWHESSHVQHAVLKHLTDSETWKTFCATYMYFSSNRRSVRLALSTDSFEPFNTRQVIIYSQLHLLYVIFSHRCRWSNLASSYCCWFRVLRLRITTLMFTYVLWSMSNTFDAHINHYSICSALLWIISDFSTYAMLFGWNIKGLMTSLCCRDEVGRKSLHTYGIICYMGHRRFLPTDHRFKRMKGLFDGSKEHREPIDSPCLEFMNKWRTSLCFIWVN